MGGSDHDQTKTSTEHASKATTTTVTRAGNSFNTTNSILSPLKTKTTTTSQRDPGDFLADEVAQIMRQDKNPKEFTEVLKYSSMTTVKLRPDD